MSLLLDENVKILNSISDELYSDLFLLGFSQGDFSPLRITTEPDPIDQLVTIYGQLDNKFKPVFRDSIAQALSIWRPEYYRLNVLEDLAILAARVRSVNSISQLITSISSFPSELDNKEYSTLSKLIGSIAGFKSPVVYDFLHKLYYDQRFDYRFTAQIFLGLCRNNPSKYHEHITMFLDVIQQHPDFNFGLNHILDDFVDYVGLPQLAEGFNNIEHYHFEIFINFLSYYRWSPIDFIYCPAIWGEIKEEILMGERFSVTKIHPPLMPLSTYLTQDRYILLGQYTNKKGSELFNNLVMEECLLLGFGSEEAHNYILNHRPHE